MVKRLFDIVLSCVMIILLIPVFIVIALIIVSTSKGPAFYTQVRVGKFNKDFKIVKFRTMHVGSESSGLLTVGGRDPRITAVGYVLRKYKLDELPQVFNVLAGSMSFVGPRPEVRKYVALYDARQLQVLNAKPGITDYASISYANENDLLAQYPDPEKAYIDIIMPAKLELNLKYLKEQSLITDIRILSLTFRKVMS